jgi:CRP/FNR family transcriptional activator FtrB
MLTTGQIVGESALFDHGYYTRSAEVVESASLLSIPLKVLKEQIHISPKLAFNMLTTMSQHYRRHYGAIALGAFQNGPQRIVCFILSLYLNNKDKDISMNLPYDKTFLSDTLHMKGATFSRALVILRQKTGIRIRGSRVEITHIEPLIKFVYGIDTAKHLLKRDTHSFPMV